MADFDYSQANGGDGFEFSQGVRDGKNVLTVRAHYTDLGTQESIPLKWVVPFDAEGKPDFEHFFETTNLMKRDFFGDKKYLDAAQKHLEDFVTQKRIKEEALAKEKAKQEALVKEKAQKDVDAVSTPQMIRDSGHEDHHAEKLRVEAEQQKKLVAEYSQGMPNPQSPQQWRGSLKAIGYTQEEKQVLKDFLDNPSDERKARNAQELLETHDATTGYHNHKGEKLGKGHEKIHTGDELDGIAGKTTMKSALKAYRSPTIRG